MPADPHITECPPDARLAELLTDSVEGTDRTVLEEHLERCSQCVQRLQDLAGDSVEWNRYEKHLRADSRCWESTADLLDPIPGDPEAWPVIAGYEILGEIGRGGMGIVYQARQVSLGRVLALKVMRAAREARPEYRRRFRREAELVASVRHPNLIHVYDFNDLPGGTYLALEYVARGSLASRLKENTLSAMEAARLVEVLARAIHTAHEAGIIHRDLKPANVLLAAPDATAASDAVVEHGTDRYVPKVTDFGLARQVEAPGETRTGMVMGTPGYMPPEQVRGGAEATPAADVYALGAILYECLVGRPPFRAETPYETLRLVVDEEPVPPSQIVHVPRDLETICLKCLRKNPGERYESAAALADDLRRFQSGRPISARRVPWWVRLGKWARRHPIPAMAIIVIAMTLVTATAAWARFTARLHRLNEDLLTQTALAQGRRAEAEDAKYALLLQMRKDDTDLLQSEGLLREQVLDVVADSGLRGPALVPVRQRLVRSLLNRHAKVIGRFPVRGEMLRARFDSYRWLGSMTMEWGTPDQAAYHLQRATQMGEEVLRADPNRADSVKAVAIAWSDLGKVQTAMKDLIKAEESYRRSRELILGERLARPRDPSPAAIEAHVLARLAEVIVRQSPRRADESAALLADAAKLLPPPERRTAGSTPAEFALELATARLEEARKQPGRARDVYRRLVARCESTIATTPHLIRFGLAMLAEAQTRWGELEKASGQHGEALAHFRSAATVWEFLAETYRPAHRYRLSWSRAEGAIAAILKETDPRGAAAAHRRALNQLGKLIEQIPDAWVYVREYGDKVLAIAAVAGPSEPVPGIDAAIQAARRWTAAEDTGDEARILIESLQRARP